MEDARQLCWDSMRVKATFHDPLYEALIESKAFERLKGISLLGAIDYLTPGEEPETRWTHSLGVAFLAMKAVAKYASSEEEARVAIVAALLHDIGHSALSHSLEPYFKQHCAIDHHHVGLDIVRGRSRYSREIANILLDHDVDPDAVCDTITGKAGTATSKELFAHPINVDTIDAISRIATRHQFRGCDSVVCVLDATIARDADVLDRFWALKGRIYREVIDNDAGVAADEAAVHHLAELSPEVKRVAYFFDDTEFFYHARGLREALARRPATKPRRWTRQFWIDTSFKVGHPSRYRRSKYLPLIAPKRDVSDDPS